MNTEFLHVPVHNVWEPTYQPAASCTSRRLTMSAACFGFSSGKMTRERGVGLLVLAFTECSTEPGERPVVGTRHLVHAAQCRVASPTSHRSSRQLCAKGSSLVGQRRSPVRLRNKKSVVLVLFTALARRARSLTPPMYPASLRPNPY